MIQSAETRLDGTTLIVRIPMRFQRRGGRKRIITPDDGQAHAGGCYVNVVLSSAWHSPREPRPRRGRNDEAAMSAEERRFFPVPDKPKVVLVLQGGGALGAYHIGCYQALAEAGYQPDWVSGISIGAINAAIIAGNPAERRLERLEQLWADISRPGGWGHLLVGDLRRWFNLGSAMEAITWGQPNFFVPRAPGPLLAAPGTPQATSFYDTGPLRATLLRLTDFDQINRGDVRISLGATRVRTGELVFFDSNRCAIGPEHVMASGALPPGFPAVEVDGELYWDGGCVSNTPLEAVVGDPPAVDTLVFIIDLWSGQGPMPTTMD